MARGGLEPRSPGAERVQQPPRVRAAADPPGTGRGAGAGHRRQGRPAHLGLRLATACRFGRRTEAVARGDAGRVRRSVRVRAGGPPPRVRGHRRAAALLGLLRPRVHAKGRPQRGRRRRRAHEARRVRSVPRVGGRRRRPAAGDRGDRARVGAADEVLAPRRPPVALDGRRAARGAARRLAARRPSRAARGRGARRRADRAERRRADDDELRRHRRLHARPLLPRLGVDEARRHRGRGVRRDGAEAVSRLPARRVYAVGAPRDAGRTGTTTRRN
mmetsp:Transcript_10769/g.29344  ORF Transcript_10769/g.29344 Transcript_10769/m.29344 type:complete len:274 (-) Transcript_10769:150-971(-)